MTNRNAKKWIFTSDVALGLTLAIPSVPVTTALTSPTITDEVKAIVFIASAIIGGYLVSLILKGRQKYKC